MGEAPGWSVGDPIVALADFRGLTIHLSGQITRIREEGDRVLVGAKVQGVPPSNDLEYGELWFDGKDFLNADISTPEVFLEDYIEVVDE